MKTIQLNTEKELRIFTLPLRQKILKEMQKTGRPVTAKQIADSLGITPSSAQHHMKQLESIGLVESDHFENIKGIRANYLRLTDVTVRVGQQFNDELASPRDAFMRRQLQDIYSGYFKALETLRADPQSFQALPGDMMSGIVHLTDRQFQELHQLIANYISSHAAASEETHPWELAFLTYRMDIAEQMDGKPE